MSYWKKIHFQRLSMLFTELRTGRKSINSLNIQNVFHKKFYNKNQEFNYGNKPLKRFQKMTITIRFEYWVNFHFPPFKYRILCKSNWQKMQNKVIVLNVIFGHRHLLPEYFDNPNQPIRKEKSGLLTNQRPWIS